MENLNKDSNRTLKRQIVRAPKAHLPLAEIKADKCFFKNPLFPHLQLNPLLPRPIS